MKGNIGSTTYASSWGVTATDIPKTGAKLFMDVGFSLGNKIYDSATADLVFSDTVVGAFPVSGNSQALDCWMIAHTAISSGTATSCDASSTTNVAVTALPMSAANTEFKFRVLATIT